MRLPILLTLPLFLAACESREVTTICASKGDVTGIVQTAFHDAEGRRIVQRHDAGTGSMTTLDDTLSEPVLEELWRLAETTMRSLPEVEASACNLDVQAHVTVTFADGSRLSRQTTCEGNALDRVATEVLAASALARLDDAEPDPAPDMARDGIAAACEALP